MKVLMVAPQPFLEPRGTPISVYQRLQGLSDLGYEVDLVTYHVGSDVEIPGVSIQRAPRVPFIKKVRIGPSLAKVPLDVMLFFKTLWMLLTRRYDVIHSHEEASFFSVVLSWLFRTPHLYDMHSSLPKQLINFNFGSYRPIIKLFEVLENWVLKSCDVVLTIGADLEDYVLGVNRQANHIRIENIAVYSDTAAGSGSMADLRRALSLDDNLAIVYTGTFEGYQGLDILFESMGIVVQRHPNIRLIMVGGRPEQVGRWKKAVEQMGLGKHVVFTGTVPLAESLQYLELADILVSPRSGGLSVPLKIYSYLYAGKPTVATNIYAHTQVLSEDNAIIVNPEPQAYADGITRLVEDPGLRKHIGQQARAYAEQEFSKEAYLRKLAKAYLAIKLCKRITEISQTELVSQQA